MSTLQSIVAPLVCLVVIWFFIKTGTILLNPGLPKHGGGKKQKAGGDFIASWTEKMAAAAIKATGRGLASVGKGLWRAFRNARRP